MNSLMLKSILKEIINLFIWYLGIVIKNLNKKSKIKNNKLIIIRTDAIGDFVLFTPSLKYLRERYSEFKITLLLQDRVKSFAENCPYIDSIISFKAKKYHRNIFYKFLFLFKIYIKDFTICINPLYSRERISDEIVLWINANEKIGWDTQSPNMTEKEKERGDKIYTKLFKSNLRKYDHELERNKEFLENLGIGVESFILENYYGQKENDRMKKIFKHFNLKGKQVFAIVPGALKQYRKWSSSNWKNLMVEIIKITKNPKFLIIGNKNGKNWIDIFPNNFLDKYVVNLCGELLLNELPSLFVRCTLVLGNENGPMHIAIFSGTPTITILGGGHFGRFMPYEDEKRNKFVYKKMDCFQCDWQCIYEEKRCITEITVFEVLKETQKLLKVTYNHIDDSNKIYKK